MAVELGTVNLALDVILKIFVIVIFGYSVLVLRSLDRTLKSVERSAESLEEASEKMGRVFTLSRILPFVGGKKDE